MMTGDLKRTYSIENLQKAWQWIKSNPEPQYKNYFREIYTAYAIAEDSYLKSLQKRLSNETYIPSSTTKLFIPKPSGILRPITLLSVEDQIVYQAFANQLACKLSRRISKNYFKKIFGHIFAGKQSTWFYMDWRSCFHKFNDAVVNTIKSGNKFAASFDLTACYDSIDHKVLAYYLSDLGFSQEFINKIVHNLSTWTALNNNKKQNMINLGHGIPQGPISSGIFSELILQAFDSDKSLHNPKVRYLRYVDDIRLYASNEKDLRLALIQLDYISKQVGLFPQSSKINIRKVTNVLEEIKSISYPPEPGLLDPDPDQDAIHNRIMELSNRYVITDYTRFKFTIARALPRAKQNPRLIKILIKYPHLYNPIMYYFSRYPKLSKTISKEMYSVLSSDDPPYLSVQSAILRMSCGKIHNHYKTHFIRFCRKKINELRYSRKSEDYRKSLLLWLIKENKLTYTRIKQLLFSKNYDPWFKSKILLDLSHDFMGRPSYEALLKQIISEYEGDLSIIACYLLIKHDCTIASSRGIKHLPSVGLKELRLLRVSNAPDSEIPRCLKEITKGDLPNFDWKKETKRAHKQLQNNFLINIGYIKTDATSWIMSLDVIMDLILNQLALHDSFIGIYQLGKIGSFLNPNSRFQQKYPKLYETCHSIHEYRKEAVLAHPITKKGKKPTRRIEFKVIKDLRPVVYNGFKELITNW